MAEGERERTPQRDHAPVLGKVTATAPIRVADVGGWTDTWFSRRGAVFNIAVSPGAQVHLRVFERGSVPHRVTLDVANFDDFYGFEPGRAPGRHPLLEAVVDDVGVPDGVALEIRVASEVPAGSSTGTSAAVAVALVGALDAVAPHGRRSAREVAQAAHRIEVEVLGLQSGVQDQLCAAFGGVNFIEIDPYPEAVRTGLPVPAPALEELGRRLLLVHLGRAHHSSEIHERVIDRLVREGEDSPALEELRACAVAARDAALAGDLERFGRAMTRNTDAQRRLHGALVSAQARAAIDVAASHGASGWKVNGAGGEGGSLSILCGPDPASHRAVERALVAADARLRVIPICLSQNGLQVGRLTPPGEAAS
jgi:D-glycero-alpha-D-manno-heptose-7-phosphate kinase